MSDSFRIKRELGRGGTATVYVAEQLSLKRDVALKVLKPSIASDTAFTDRFLAEGRTVAALRHRHIVTVYDVGVMDGKAYICMEYLPLGSIAAADVNLDPRQAMRCIREIAGALDYAHRHGVIHRDVKPENILRDEDGGFLLSDFGIARTNGDAKLTAEGELRGTPAYMSPEQWHGEQLDGRSDLYGLGVTMHQLLTGNVPYEGADSWAIGMKHMSAPIPALPAPFASLQGMLARLLAKDPKDRFATGADVVAQIESLEREGAIPAQSLDKPSVTPLSRSRTSRLLREWPHAAAAQYFLPESHKRPIWSRYASVTAGVLVALAAVASLSVWKPWKHLQAASSPPAAAASIAVLPFADLSPTKDQEYFADGLSEELLDILTGVPGLRVSGRTSSFSFKGKNAKPADIARELNVTSLLDGTVRKSGNHIRVSAQLINAADGFPLWSKTYDRETTDLFSVQDDIANAVVDALKVKLLPNQSLSMAAHRSANSAAYDQYLLGRQFSLGSDRQSDIGAIQAYLNAISLDTKFAAAYAGLATEEYFVADSSDDTKSAEQDKRNALAAADHALELDPNLAEGYQARGLLRTLVTADWNGAQSDFERALALDPGDSNTLRRYGILLITLGKVHDAIDVTKKAIDLDPLAASAWSNLGRMLLADGRQDEATQALKRATQLSPTAVYPKFNLGFAYMVAGDPTAALSMFQQMPDKHYLHLAGVAMAEYALGHKQESQQALDALISAPAQRPYGIAWVYMARGDRDQTFVWLDKAFDRHDSFISTIKTEPFLKGMRDDPRYIALLQKMGLPL